MKKCFFSFIFFFFISSFLFSDYSSNVYGGIQHTYVRLKFNNPSDLRGFLTGITVGYELDYCSYFGDIDFEGYWTTGRITGDPCQRSSIQEYFVKGKVGMNFITCENIYLKPYLGFGWNYLRNKQDPCANGGLLYQFNKLFIPVGISAIWQYSDLFAFGILGEWRPDVYSRVHAASHCFKLDYSHAFRIESPLLFSFASCFEIGIIPFFDWNRFGETCERTSLGVRIPIPRLIRWDLGLKVLLNYQF